MEWVSINATHNWAHQSRAGVTDGSHQCIVKSVGGSSSKIHLAVDEHGNSIEFIVGDGVTYDIKIFGLLDLKGSEFLNADKGYDFEAFLECSFILVEFMLVIF